MKERLAKLIDVKSIITIVFTIVFAVLSVTGTIEPSDFMSTFLIIITYFFTRNNKTVDNAAESDYNNDDILS